MPPSITAITHSCLPAEQISLSLCFSVSVCLCLSVCFSVCACVCLCLCPCLSVSVCLCLSLWLLPLCLCLSLSLSLSVCLSDPLSLCLFTEGLEQCSTACFVFLTQLNRWNRVSKDIFTNNIQIISNYVEITLWCIAQRFTSLKSTQLIDHYHWQLTHTRKRHFLRGNHIPATV